VVFFLLCIVLAACSSNIIHESKWIKCLLIVFFQMSMVDFVLARVCMDQTQRIMGEHMRTEKCRIPEVVAVALPIEDAKSEGTIYKTKQKHLSLVGLMTFT
jgi:hypothetical protein